jgi:hypothetical protein
MKTLNFIRASTLVSDTNTDDPITQTGNYNIRPFSETNIPSDFFLYVIKLGDKHCTRFGYGGAFKLENGVLAGAPVEILNRVKQGTAKIVLSWPLESFMEDSIFLEIHEYFKFYNISLTSVIYLNCCPNGKEIYEGDIICDEMNNSYLLIKHIEDLYFNDCLYYPIGTQDCIIVGNIFENPELLEML